MKKFQEYPESESDLLELIGKGVPSGELNMFAIPPGRDEAIRRAMEWLGSQHVVLRDKLCRNKQVHDLDGKTRPREHSPERELLFEMVCGILTESFVQMPGIPIGVVTAYLIRRTIRSLCASKEGMFPNPP